MAPAYEARGHEEEAYSVQRRGVLRGMAWREGGGGVTDGAQEEEA